MKKRKIAKQHETSDLERRIDLMVYTLYDLSYDEVKIVDPDFALSAEEYGHLTRSFLTEH